MTVSELLADTSFCCHFLGRQTASLATSVTLGHLREDFHLIMEGKRLYSSCPYGQSDICLQYFKVLNSSWVLTIQWQLKDPTSKHRCSHWHLHRCYRRTKAGRGGREQDFPFSSNKLLDWLIQMFNKFNPRVVPWFTQPPAIALYRKSAEINKQREGREQASNWLCMIMCLHKVAVEN